MVLKQIKKFHKNNNQTFVVGGGKKNSISLKDLTKVMVHKTGYKIKVLNFSKTSLYDVPYFISNIIKVSKLYKWKPNVVEVFAGKLDYSKYNFFNKNIIRLIMFITKGPTQTDEVIEFTDWNKVEKFAQSIDNFQLMKK